MQYALEWEEKNKSVEKEGNYTGGQIGKYLHSKKMAKFEVGETIRKKFKEVGLWYDRYIESINHGKNILCEVQQR